MGLNHEKNWRSKISWHTPFNIFGTPFNFGFFFLFSPNNISILVIFVSLIYNNNHLYCFILSRFFILKLFSNSVFCFVFCSPFYQFLLFSYILLSVILIYQHLYGFLLKTLFLDHWMPESLKVNLFLFI